LSIDRWRLPATHRVPVQTQAHDRAPVAEGGAVAEMFLIRPALAENARVIWPDADPGDEPTAR
jgi:hypothetical protein